MNHRSVLTAYVSAPWSIQDGHLSALCTLMVEGVHHGSAGALFWPAHVLKQATPAWQDAPVTLSHPEIDGTPVSVNHTPEIFQRYAVGRLVKPWFDEQKKALRGTVTLPWNHPKAAQIQQTKEVSVGIFSDEQYTPGAWNGEAYSACAIDMQPDHLALLPNERGACSWADGCGIRNNQTYEGAYEMSEILMPRAGMLVDQDSKEIMTLAEWEASGMLPTTDLYAMLQKDKAANHDQGVSDSPEILLPTGVVAS